MTTTNKKDLTILGIDPGLTGACAVISIGYGGFKLLDVADIVSFYPTPGKSKRRELDVHETVTAIRALKEKHAPHLCAIEYQQAFPGQGVSSTFKLGMCYGVLMGALKTMGMSYTTYRPTIWKTEIVGAKCSKIESIAKCRELMDCGELIIKSMHHNRAEAALVGVYSARNTLKRLRNRSS